MGLFAFLVGVTLVGCKVGEPYKRPDFSTDDTGKFYSPDGVATDSILMEGVEPKDTTLLAAIPWKSYIQDTVLVALIDEALSNNIDMQKTMQELQIGMEQLEQSKANFYPSLNSTPGGYRREYYSENYNNYGSNRARTNHGEDVPTSFYTERMEYTSALQASWEADIWGKLRWKKEAARAQYMKSLEFKKAVQTSLISEVASTYYNLLMLKAQVAVATKTYQLNDSTLNIVKLQYDAGESTSLAVRQTQSRMLKSKTLVPQLERQYAIVENHLNYLLGRAPQPIVITTRLDEVSFQRIYSTGVPLDLIKNRPDVAMAEYELMKRNAKAGVAEALKYPSLTIDASAGLNSRTLSNFFDPVGSGFALLNGSIFQPIFNNRKLKTNYRVALSEKEIAQLDFKDNLLLAIGDVSTSLATINKLEEEYAIAQERIQVTRQGLKDAGLLFKSGFANYLEVITAQSDALESELNLIDIKKQILIANIELYRSLGGGWQ
ncbi:RND transporter [Neptunitalea sp. Y10]|uniref:RND transporter n=2 Tax=Neptunitalea lumnitzerae TaxID=2965509 RepID=A0ABQ5MF00_9FLAO|nr:RND transporter [Neptunitalea sp. Y10]